MDSFANQLGALTLHLGALQDSAAVAASGLPLSACTALVTLGPQPSSIGALARIAGVSHSVMVRNADQLVARGLAIRSTGTEDRRSVTLTLTDAGHALCDQILMARARALAPAVFALTTAEQVAALPLLHRMLAALTDSRATADHLCRLCDRAACGPACPVDAASPTAA